MSIVLKISFALGFGALLFIACGDSQGDSCTSDGDCGSNLQCQAIAGRNQSFCCPTPPENSDYQNCHAITPTPTPAGSSPATPAPDAAASTPAPADAGTGG